MEGCGEYGYPESHAASFAHLVYASAWLKVHHPVAFAAALINSQPMGFYSVSSIVKDAERHGVEVRPVSVEVSDWDCTLESNGPSTTNSPLPTPSAPPVSLGHGPALRLGMRSMAGQAQT